MIVQNKQLSLEQLNIVKSLAERSGISFTVAKILFTRGINTVNKVKRFLSPGKQHFSDPMQLKGMAEAVERIKYAKDNGETIVIYGDYDADGICASAILYYALKDFGIEAHNVIPERDDGYGLSEKLIDDAMERYNPDLIITVDCGISGKDEVEYIQDLGVDVIVTDHHELPEELPNCITVNCKFKEQEYGFDGLCGAGIAFKLATALIGSRANAYLDFAALATVADSMPLVDENRDIVYEGLKMLKGVNARKCFKAIIDEAKGREVSSTMLAYALAPRVNAAGRMGDAHSALTLFKSESPSEIFELAAKLNQYNIERQIESDKLYEEAKAKLLKKGANKRIILLEGEGWRNGLVGIAASKLVEEFTRPVIMFVNTNGILHGSARSLEEVNILEAIIYNKDKLIAFGGHSQAAGVTLSIDNFEEFERGMDEYISRNYGDEVFVPKKEVEDFIDEPFTLELAEEIAKLEPFGAGNRKPLFACEAEFVRARPMKEGSPHLNLSVGDVDMVYFGGAQYVEQLNAPVKKTVVFEPGVSTFRGKDSLSCLVKAFELEVEPNRELGLETYRKNLRILRKNSKGTPANYVSGGEMQGIVEKALECPYGTLFVVSTLKTLESYPSLKNLPVGLNRPPYKNLSNCVVLVLTGGEINGFERIVFLDNPVYEVKTLPDTEVFVNKDMPIREVFPKVAVTRAGVGEVFAVLKSYSGRQADSSVALYLEICKEVPQISRYQFVFGAEVLEELGIITYENGRMRYRKEIRADINSSLIYTKLLDLN